MMNTRLPIVIATLAFAASLGLGCEDVDHEPETPEPAAARSPIHVTDDAPEGERPADEEETAEALPDKPEPIKLTWFKGVDNLPVAHPCHDSTKVIYADDDFVPEEGEVYDFRVRTLGEMRENPDHHWVHFGARLAKGVRWKRDEEEFVVATCSMGGTGYGGYNGYLDGKSMGVNGNDPKGAEFHIGRVGEPNNIEFGTVRWMKRSEGGAWETTFERDAWAWDDEGNDPEYTARARIIAAGDSDGDREPEVVALTIDHSYDFKSERLNKAICPEQDPRYRCYGFELEVIAREGAATLVDRVMLQLNGKHALTEEAVRPEGMTDEAYETLRSQLDAHRDDAVAKARAILREDGKLR